MHPIHLDVSFPMEPELFAARFPSKATRVGHRLISGRVEASTGTARPLLSFHWSRQEVMTLR